MSVDAEQMWVPPAPSGWQCPRCRIVNAPIVTQCPCSPMSAGEWPPLTWPVADGWVNVTDAAGTITGYRLG